MNKIILTLASALLGAFCVPAQDDVSSKEAIRAQLSPESSAVAPDKAAILRLTVEVVTACEVSPTLLSGMRIHAHFGGEKRHEIVDEVGGSMVKLAAGTRLERTFEIDMKGVLEGGDVVAESVTFKWPGLGGAEAQVRVVDLERLDYANTRVVLQTNYGDITLGFRPDKAPNHVKNFVKLAATGFYDDTKFHRVIKGFMIQGGCPNTKKDATGAPGTGNPGYTIDAEFNDTQHVKGVLSMARSTDPNSAGCQFFIVHDRAAHLDNQYTAFGQVEQGLDVVDQIANVPCGGPQRSSPRKPVHLRAAVVLPAYK